MSMQPLNHLRIVEAEMPEDKLDYETSLRLLTDLSGQIVKMRQFYVHSTELKFSKLGLISGIGLVLFSSKIMFDLILIRKKANIQSLDTIITTMWIILGLYGIYSHSIELLIRKQKIISELKNKSGQYFSFLLPLSETLTVFQSVTNHSHHLIDSSDITSWQKIDLSVKLKEAEEELTWARILINKYDPSLLPK